MIGDAAGQLGGLAVELVRQLADPILLQLQQAAAEGVGFEHVGASFEKGRVDVLDDPGIDDRQVIVTALFAAVLLRW